MTTLSPSPLCTGCESAVATLRIRVRGCIYARCAPCGSKLLCRLLVIEPDHEATVEPIASVAASEVAA